jgi:hypothetical protein
MKQQILLPMLSFTVHIRLRNKAEIQSYLCVSRGPV